MKKVLSIILVLAMAVACFTLAACEDKPLKAEPENDNGDAAELPVHVSNDKFRSYYHIWVCAFEDSNGDETGDLQGIINKLDYINDGDPETDTDLGLDAIWLSPIMPSDSYHKYDVDDYMDIDPEFGDLETFDKLIAECDKRGIDVILDLVLNHCGTGHELWRSACKEARTGNLDGNAKYYRFTTDGSVTNTGWHNVIGGGRLWYEGQFSPEMPEWNLEYEGTRDYFEEVAKFWLERGVAGFRLDAVMYMTDETTDGTEFLNWFYKTAQKYNPDVYMVGENWQGNSEIYDTYQSGIDSQFAFSFATGSGHFPTYTVSGRGENLANQLKKFDEKSKEANPDAINAFFLSNHDMVRSGNYFAKGLPDQKMAAAVYLLTPGNSFTYYGEEIGMEVPEGCSDNDAFYRGAMNWDEENPNPIWCVADAYSDCPYGGVEQQTKDPDSLLSFYRDAIKVKNQSPQIARGDITEVLSFGDSAICAFKVEYEGEEIVVLHNLDDEEGKTLTLTEDMLKEPVLRGKLFALTQAQMEEVQAQSGEKITEISLSGTELKLPPHSTVVLGSAE